MNIALDFLIRHGYGVLFIWVLLEQLGLPVPSVPLLMAAGALVATGRMGAGSVLFLSVVGSVISDSVWFELGRRRGGRTLRFLCKVSLEPDSCVRQTELSYRRLGWRALLLAKFIPGISTAAPPLAGIIGMSYWQFLFYDALGALLWSASFTMIGFAFHHQLELAAGYMSRFGVSLLTFLIIGLAGYITYKYVQRKRFLNKLRIARLHARELKQMLDEGEPVFIVDLRAEYDFAETGQTLPGAVRIDPGKMAELHADIPRDRDIILYCT